jgi:hypothetical protein
VTNLSTAQPAAKRKAGRVRERARRKPREPRPDPPPALREAGEAPVPLRFETPKRRRSAKPSRLLPGRMNEPNRTESVGGDELEARWMNP